MADVITGVAVMGENGAIVALPRPFRHHHIFAISALLGINLGDGCQGFITDAGHFVNRKAAFKMVVANNQPNRRSGSPASTELFSEDVW